MPYVRNNFFAGETFIDLADCRARAERWCTETAGTRIHGTTQCRPIEAFRAEELPRLLCLPGAPFDVPMLVRAKVHRDFHVEVGQGDLLRPAPPDRPAGQGPAGLDDGEAVLPRRSW